MMIYHLNAFNEEYGEMSLSHLSRCVLGDNRKHEFDHVSKLYTMLGIERSISKEHVDEVGHLHSGKSHKTIAVDSPEVEIVTETMKDMITSMKNGDYGIYDGSKDAYSCKGVGEALLDRIDVPELIWTNSSLKHLKKLVKYSQKKTCCRWSDKYPREFPAELPIPDEPDKMHFTFSHARRKRLISCRKRNRYARSPSNSSSD